MRKITFLLFFTLNFLTAQTTYNFDWSYGTPDQQIEIEVGDEVEVEVKNKDENESEN
jgi:FtsP/CotA-like multicopper oxidase with cupredoxin domain